MRFFMAFKTLIFHYPSIISIYLVVIILQTFIGNVAPLIGTVLLLPLKVSVAAVMLNALLKDKKAFNETLGIGFKQPVYFKNVLTLLLQQYLYLLPFGLGLIFVFLTYYQLNDVPLYSIIIVFFSGIFSIILSLLFAMVPFLLADKDFNQTKHNAILHSAKILKGSYLKLIFIRLFFATWMIWLGGSFIFSIIGFFGLLSEEPSRLTYIIPAFLISLPLTVLLVQPFYHMMHATLYLKLKSKL